MASPAVRFTPALVKFLRELSKNNDRKWFQANKARYQESVQQPFLAFVAAMAEEFRRFAPHITADDGKVGGAMMRINRDTRFGKDKSPYNTWVGARFRHEVGKDVDAPGFYIRVSGDGVTLGSGIWQPEPPALAGIRQSIVDQPAVWVRSRAGKAFQASWKEEGGERLKRPPRGFPDDHPHVEDLKRKDFVAFAALKQSDLTAPDFVKRVAKAYKATDKFMHFLCDAVGVAWR